MLEFLWIVNNRFFKLYIIIVEYIILIYMVINIIN